MLYVWGELQERDQHAIGVIGARRTTHYGTESAKKLSYQLAYAGLTVISGLARGIDTAAHQGALAAKGRTIAVIGSGLARLYPPENRASGRKNPSGNGAVVSEFSMDIEPDRQTFPMRNRIISGWSHGILVVEAGLNSGALITAAQALEQGRSVYAVPGHINAPSAMGSNRLIQQGAKLVMDASTFWRICKFCCQRRNHRRKPRAAAASAFRRRAASLQRDRYDRDLHRRHRPSERIAKRSGFIDAFAAGTQTPGQAVAWKILRQTCLASSATCYPPVGKAFIFKWLSL